MRDDFSEDVKRKLATRAGHLCSNPKCKRPTSGPSETDKVITNVGEAAHITAASEGGARYDPSLTPEQRSSIENGIWLCSTCSKAVDDDANIYTELFLRDWKTEAEKSAHKAIEEGPQPQQATRDQIFVLRLDAYRSFRETLLKQPRDRHVEKNVIVQLELIQPYSSDNVRAKAHELFEYAKNFRRSNQGNIPRDFIDRVDAELLPIIMEEIKKIMSEEK